MCNCCQNLNRRQFLGTSTAAALAADAKSQVVPQAFASAASEPWPDDYWDPSRPFAAVSRPLRVQPILMYATPARKEARSWKSWGDIQTREAALQEARRIEEELAGLARQAEFPLQFLPVAAVSDVEQAARAHAGGAQATIVFPATGSGDLLRSCIPDRNTVVFVRHQSGPIYYWYEALSTRYLKPDREEFKPDDRRRLTVHDVVVDDLSELLWRLRGLHAAHNFMGSRVVAVGGPMGKYDGSAPQVARDRYRFEILDYGYPALEARIQAVFADPRCRSLAEKWAAQYLSLARTRLATDRGFVVNAFLLYGIFKDLLKENRTHLFTINNCMSTIMPMAKTTACLTLSLMNDEGLVAFCESDFVIIPAGILLSYLARKPVFMHNSTFPHNGMVTCAHCTSPRRMDRDRYEPALITTHYESEYGAAPKVDFRQGQTVSFIDPEYATGRWLGIRGRVESNPSFEICRSQQDVRIDGKWRRLLEEVRDSHWMMVYGDVLKEAGYAAPRIGVTWDSLCDPDA